MQAQPSNGLCCGHSSSCSEQINIQKRGKRVLPGLLVGLLLFGTDPICDRGTESERQSRAEGRCSQRLHVGGRVDEEGDRNIREEVRKCL